MRNIFGSLVVRAPPRTSAMNGASSPRTSYQTTIFLLFSLSAVMREYVLERGVPPTPGETTLEVHGKNLEATTYVDGVPIIRTRAKVSKKIGVVARGHLTYVTKLGRKLIAGNYAYIGDLVDPYELLSVEFLAPDHPLWAIRPAQPFQPVTGSCWFAPRDSFVYPGGEYEI